MYGHWITVNYRESYGCSRCRDPVQPRVAAPRREFVTRKITEAVARIKLGLQDELRWATSTRSATGAMRRVRRGDVADAPGAEGVDYVIGTGVHHSVRECLDYAFAHVGLDPTTSCASIPH
jgi:GDPmannose 4,6-dehydratase